MRTSQRGIVRKKRDIRTVIYKEDRYRRADIGKTDIRKVKR